MSSESFVSIEIEGISTEGDWKDCTYELEVNIGNPFYCIGPRQTASYSLYKWKEAHWALRSYGRNRIDHYTTYFVLIRLNRQRTRLK